MRGYFQHAIRAAMRDHRMKISLQLDRIRRGIQRFLYMISDFHIESTDNSRFAVGIIQHLINHMCCCCFAVRPRNPDQFQLLGRITEKGVG